MNNKVKKKSVCKTSCNYTESTIKNYSTFNYKNSKNLEVQKLGIIIGYFQLIFIYIYHVRQCSFTAFNVIRKKLKAIENIEL